MVKSDWLLNYGAIEGLNRALTGMARRTPYESGMEQATDDLKKNYHLYEKEFRTFFPDIMQFSQEKIQAEF